VNLSLRNKISKKNAVIPVPKLPITYKTLFDHEMKRKVKEGIPAAFLVPPLPAELMPSQPIPMTDIHERTSSDLFPGWTF